MVCSIIDGSRIESRTKFSHLKIAQKTPVHSRILKLDLIQLLRVNEQRVSLQHQLVGTEQERSKQGVSKLTSTH